MKHKMSITIEEKVALDIFELMRTRAFKNKSQFFEAAAKKMIEEKNAN